MKIVSGGQTGADRAALDLALERGVDCGGWCPRGRRAEDGPIDERYPLRETDSTRYAVRTERNVIDSDATVLITRGPATGGSALTARLARRHRKPLLEIDLARDDLGAAAERLRRFIDEIRPAVLNVAGPRESTTPGIGDLVKELLGAALDAP